MILGKHINRYYLRYGLWLLLGLAALILVDTLQLEIPRFYRMVLDGMTYGQVEVAGETLPFTLDFVLDTICMPMVVVILLMIFSFRKVDQPAAWLQIPYLLWVTFAAYLNFGVWLLN